MTIHHLVLEHKIIIQHSGRFQVENQISYFGNGKELLK